MKMTTMLGIAFAALMAALLHPSASQAGVIQVFSRSELSANDQIDWGTLGSNGDLLSNPFDALSAGGLGAVVSKASVSGDFQLLVQGAGWGGNFSPGDTVLWTNNYPEPSPRAITLSFDGLIAGIGMNIQQANALGSFTAQMEAYDAADTFLGLVSVTGASNSNNDGSAVFLGLKSTTADIQKAVFYLTAAPFNYVGSYGINQVDLVVPEDVPPPSPVPEPSSLVAWSIGMLLLGGRRLRLWA